MKRSVNRAQMAALALPLILVALACGQDETPAPTPAPTLPTSEELRQAGDELFGALSTAVQARDAEAFHELMVVSVRERCSVEQVQGVLMSGDAPFADVDVTAVFLDLEDPTRALVRVALREEPEEGLAGLATTFATLLPFPIAKEAGGWRLDLLGLVGGLDTVEGCPFDEEEGGQSEVVEARPRALVPSEDTLRSVPSLTPPPGVNSLGAGGGRGVGEATSSVLLETEMSLTALLEFYRQQVMEPGWQVQQEEVTDGLAVLTWTFQDDEDFSWFGVLLVTPAGEGLRQVRLWVAGGGTPVP